MTTTTSRRTLNRGVARAASLCLLALAAVLLQGREARAQWTTSGTNTTTTNNVGVGTATPASSLHVSTPTTSVTRGIIDEQTSNDSNSALFTFSKSRAGGAVVNGDNIGSLFASAFDGSAMQTPTRLRFFVDGPVSAGSVPTAVQFFTGANGAGVERMRIGSNGNVGVGTAAPLGVFDVTTTGAANGGGIDFVVKDSVMANSNPLVLSHKVGTSSGALTRIGFNVYSNSTNFAVVNPSAGGWAIQSDTRNGITDPTLQFSSFTNAPVKNDVLTLTQGGNIGVGTTTPASKLHVAGNITVDGNINAKYQDVAEWVPSTQKLQAGTVVVLDTRHANHVIASAGAYDTRVAGVVSAQPGITLGEAGEDKALVATTGRVKVRVDASRAAIGIGDLIVTSDVEGLAMKSEPISLGGRQIHAPGTIIGKALESLDKGTGEILVLLSLQ